MTRIFDTKAALARILAGPLRAIAVPDVGRVAIMEAKPGPISITVGMTPDQARALAAELVAAADKAEAP